MTQNKEQLYDIAIWGLKQQEDISEFLLKFDPGDIVLIERVIQAIRVLLQREDITPVQIRSISRCLLGLYRLPLVTPGLEVDISISEKGEGGAESYHLLISDDHFEINSGGYINSPGGSDSFSGPTFEVEARFRSDINIYDLNWTDIFQEAAKSWALDIYDDSHEELLDWEERDASMFWEWIEEHLDRQDTQFEDWMSDHSPGWKGLE